MPFVLLVDAPDIALPPIPAMGLRVLPVEGLSTDVVECIDTAAEHTSAFCLRVVDDAADVAIPRSLSVSSNRAGCLSDVGPDRALITMPRSDKIHRNSY